MKGCLFPPYLTISLLLFTPYRLLRISRILRNNNNTDRKVLIIQIQVNILLLFKSASLMSGLDSFLGRFQDVQEVMSSSCSALLQYYRRLLYAVRIAPFTHGCTFVPLSICCFTTANRIADLVPSSATYRRLRCFLEQRRCQCGTHLTLHRSIFWRVQVCWLGCPVSCLTKIASIKQLPLPLSAPHTFKSFSCAICTKVAVAKVAGSF